MRACGRTDWWWLTAVSSPIENAPLPVNSPSLRLLEPRRKVRLSTLEGAMLCMLGEPCAIRVPDLDWRAVFWVLELLAL